MTKMDPIVLIALECAGIPDEQVAEIFQTDTQTVVDYMACYQTGFDGALLYMGNRLKKAGLSEAEIDLILGIPTYSVLKAEFLPIPGNDVDSVPLEMLKKWISDTGIQRLKRNLVKSGKKQDE